MRTPEEAARAQLDAYNARDLDAFAACYAPDVQALDLESGRERFAGMEALRGRYGVQFAASPAQRARLVSRQIVGEFVFDLEEVTGSSGLPDARVMAIYRVRGGLIDRVWFSPRAPVTS